MSFIQHISNWLISKKETTKSAKQFLNWSQLSSVVLIAYDHQLSNCVDFINVCKKDNIHVLVAIIFEGKPEHAPRPDFNHLILDKKQFTLFGLPKDDVIHKLSSKPIDVLINLGEAKQVKAFALSKLVPAKCKIGSFQNGAFEMTINSDKTLNSSDYLKQVIVYLNMIKPTTK
ncbi:MAG: hypothetical protein K0S53_2080 [Bacteroidetes bacterium]|nr:hypothetical protein [Bacteroidota bacterium]